MPSPSPIPCTRVVFPAPNGPARVTRSPGRSSSPRRRPSARVASADAVRITSRRSWPILYVQAPERLGYDDLVSRIAVVADIHANLAAFEAVIAAWGSV